MTCVHAVALEPGSYFQTGSYDYLAYQSTGNQDVTSFPVQVSVTPLATDNSAILAIGKFYYEFK